VLSYYHKKGYCYQQQTRDFGYTQADFQVFTPIEETPEPSNLAANRRPPCENTQISV